MKIVILAGSPHQYGCGYKFIQSFKDGAVKHKITVIPVGNMNINGCLACNACHCLFNGKCIQNDDMQKIYPFIDEAELLVFASPIYFGGLTGQLQSLITRLYRKIPPAGTKVMGIFTAETAESFDIAEHQIRYLALIFNWQILDLITFSSQRDNMDEMDNRIFRIAERI